MDSLDFSEEEIQEQLAILGYKNIPKHRLREFKQDLDGLIRHGEWKTFASSNQINSTENHPALSQPSPPAYTKEKGQGTYSGQGFFLHADHERQVSRHCDSYAQHSLAPNLQPPPGAPTRLQVEPDPEDTLHPPFTDSYTSSPDTQGRRFIKRKVLSDESVCLEDRLAELHLSTSPCHGSETENEDVTSQSDSRSSEPDGISLTAFESYIRGMTRSQSDGDLRPKPKSFIRPVMSQQTIKKTDPVAKYFQYKQLWEMFKLPGEKDRRALRLEMKPKPRRVYVPNTYIVPTEKKRSALRWEIRNDLANGLLPHKFTYRF
uniref:HYLS1 centriolar and ciliogenesis associated n=1 Tax=Seriola lalandi dorsalis TaxID=1841481 RepID=A0A3B4XMH5_SERLL